MNEAAAFIGKTEPIDVARTTVVISTWKPRGTQFEQTSNGGKKSDVAEKRGLARDIKGKSTQKRNQGKKWITAKIVSCWRT